MSKITLNNISSFQNDSTAVASYTANNATLTTAFDNTLSRDGTSPNQMGANLDMNSFHILNLPAPASVTDPLRVVDLASYAVTTANQITVPTTTVVGQSVVWNATNGLTLGSQPIYTNGSNLGFGTETNPQFPIVFSTNATTGIPFTGNITAFTGPWTIGATGIVVGWNVLAIAAAGTNNIVRFDGTVSSPTNLVNNDVIGAVNFGGWGAGTFQGGRCQINVTTTEAWTATFGSSVVFLATPVGGIRAEAMRIGAGVSIGTTTDPGAGNIICNKITVANGVSNGIQLTAASGSNGAVSMGAGGTIVFTMGSAVDAFAANDHNNQTCFQVTGPIASASTALAGKTNVASNVATPAGGLNTAGLTLGTTANLGLFYGSGAPTLSAAQGSVYIRTDGSSTSTRLYVNTNGTTGWTNFTSAT